MWFKSRGLKGIEVTGTVVRWQCWNLKNDYIILVAPLYILHLLTVVLLCIGICDNVLYTLNKKDLKRPEMTATGVTWRCLNRLTHLPLVLHICVSKLGQHWFVQWLVAYSAPSHYLNQCWVIVNWTLRNKLQWNFNQNAKLFTKCIWKYRLRNGSHIVQGEISEVKRTYKDLKWLQLVVTWRRLNRLVIYYFIAYTFL